MPNAHEIISDLVDHVAQDLLEHYNLSWTHQTERSQDATARCAAVLGFSGRELRGVIGIVADYPVLEESRRMLLGAVGSRSDVHDWAGELSNQLLGRLKNKLLKLGQDIQLATPLVLRGLQLEVRGAGRPPVVHGFRTEHGDVWVWLDADMADDLALVEVVQEEGGIDEGEMMMF